MRSLPDTDLPKRRFRPAAAAAVVAMLALASPVAAQQQPTAPPVSPPGTPPLGATHLLEQLYLDGEARMAEGDPARAVAAFALVRETVPELPQAHYALAVALLLADFGNRQRALPEINQALAVEPQHPLFATIGVMADPDLSALRADGALYLTADGAARLRDAAARLPGLAEGRNGRYLVPILAAVEATGEQRYPFRLSGFAAKVAPHGTVVLTQTGDRQPFGRLFALTVPDTQFRPYEARLIAHLPGGLASLTENGALEQSRDRAEILRRLEASPAN
jgi:tetratricopeptide (TPR) repeat protein